ncbi:carboxypeptidase-like regulatory domain-containing protein [Bizionia argentinensis]|uniref:carboxypeptidase-like regulatory domain-containing protein n=1 Tax=Bizionia argentinensis TaxID=456455 RepID=UPI0002230620|nr:carboxypeptidase-like regulatory domain-containing protein [Bizionia argentinensis]
MKISFLQVFFLFFCLSSYAQFNKIKGNVVSNKDNLPINSVSITIKDNSEGSILDYTYTNEQGEFSFDLKDKGSFYLTFASLGFENKSMTLVTNDKELKIDVLLKEKLTILNEVIIKSSQAILVKKDTIVFNAAKFSNGTEQTVEDLLKKIPGLIIDDDGTIKVGNKEIEKLMIDGDDLFEKGYKILSKNMPSYPIKEIEVLENYSNNRLLKGIEESDKVALNLKLKEDAKRI